MRQLQPPLVKYEIGVLSRLLHVPLAKVVLTAQDLHERSFDPGRGTYKLGFADAAAEACRAQGFDGTAWPALITLLISELWDDAEEWARDTRAAEEGP